MSLKLQNDFVRDTLHLGQPVTQEYYQSTHYLGANRVSVGTETMSLKYSLSSTTTVFDIKLSEMMSFVVQ